MDLEEEEVEENFFTNKERSYELKLFGIKDKFRLTERRLYHRKLMNRLIRKYYITLQSINVIC